jgi:hypothetical protein
MDKTPNTGQPPWTGPFPSLGTGPTEPSATAARIRYASTPYHRLMARRYGYRVICVHVSHRLRLPCLRSRTYDGYCGKHNRSCFQDDMR